MLKPLGLYIHIPFCKQKCIYCDFYSLPGQEGQMDAYCASLQARLTETDFSGYTVDTVYFGKRGISEESIEKFIENSLKECLKREYS